MPALASCTGVRRPGGGEVRIANLESTPPGSLLNEGLSEVERGMGEASRLRLLSAAAD
ncbi:MAG: hypothetical protein ACR2IK_05825 [Chloroflexota bacterium]